MLAKWQLGTTCGCLNEMKKIKPVLWSHLPELQRFISKARGQSWAAEPQEIPLASSAQSPAAGSCLALLSVQR